jgi:hypothetical protein
VDGERREGRTLVTKMIFYKARDYPTISEFLIVEIKLFIEVKNFSPGFECTVKEYVSTRSEFTDTHGTCAAFEAFIDI